MNTKTISNSPNGRAVLAFMLVLLLGIIFNADGAFFKLGTHRDALRQASVFGILACGMTISTLSVRTTTPEHTARISRQKCGSS